MQGKLQKSAGKRAYTIGYISPSQIILEEFEAPFEQQLSKNKPWVQLAKIIPWGAVVPIYERPFKSKEGRPPINGRIVTGDVIIKHKLNLNDEETMDQIKENMYMQSFLGFSGYTNEEPLSAPHFVDIRKRLSLELMTKITDEVAKVHNIHPSLKKKMMSTMIPTIQLQPQ